MGKVMGVLPRTLKSKALWVYFQMYSPLTTASFAEGLLQAGVELVAEAGLERSRRRRVQASRGASTAFEQPWLERTRFSLKGVSRVRA